MNHKRKEANKGITQLMISGPMNPAGSQKGEHTGLAGKEQTLLCRAFQVNQKIACLADLHDTRGFNTTWTSKTSGCQKKQISRFSLESVPDAAQKN